MKSSVGVVLLLGCFLWIAMVYGFDGEKFKKCSDSSFCERNRQKTEDRIYRVQDDTIQFTETILTARVANVALEEMFILTLTSVLDSVRFQFTEENPSERYEVQNVLVEDPPLSGAPWLVEKEEKSIQLKLPTAIVVLNFDPFTLVVNAEGEDVIRINGNHLFHMEHRLEEVIHEFNGRPDYTENFHKFHDSRPKGPMAMSLDLTFLGISHVFGIPEHATDLSLSSTIEDGKIIGEPYRLYNLDVFGYEFPSSFGLYGSIPLLLGQEMEKAAGVFWLNAAEMYIDIWKDEIGTHGQWMTESGAFDVFLMVGSHSRDILKAYSGLTGTVALPQYFALGYHQCRWNYRNEDEVYQVDGTFDELGIPYDVLWLDIEHTDHKKYMTWDSTSFPQPIEMQNDLASRGRKMVAIVDPHIKRDSNYKVHQEAEKNGYYVKGIDGKDFEGHCWPGSSSYLDVIRPEVRSWWADHFQIGEYEGMTKYLYIWNDMNEPSVFNGPEITMEKDLLHNGTIEHRDVHNIYGFFYHMATSDGLLLRGVKTHGSDGDRPFVLSRAYFAGSQRLGPIWTGDNQADWTHLRASIPMLLSNSLTGMVFCGADVGGFFGDPDSELFTRWYQVGIFYPFFRGHAHIETKRREPWVYGEPTTSRVRNALRERYALLPYLYTLFRQSNLTGEAIMRPLWYEFPSRQLFESQEQFMLGPALMVRPIFEHGAESVDTIFPKGALWYDAWTGEKVQLPTAEYQKMVTVDMERIPFYYRGGSIVPRKERPRRSTTAMVSDPLTLVIALDEQGKAEGEFYTDDGHSFAFLRSQYLHRKFIFSDYTLTSTEIHSAGRKSHFKANLQVEKIVILGFSSRFDVHEKHSKRQIQTSFGGLRLEESAPQVALTVKKPKVNIDEDWTLIFTQAKH